MPWKAVSVMSLRYEFVLLARQEGVKLRELCRRYGVSPTTAYKWVGRFEKEGEKGLQDRSRRPRGSPGRTAAEVEAAVLACRDRHPAWGGRKLRVLLREARCPSLPAASTITAILRRHGRLDPQESAKHKAWVRFEHEAPNCLWQIDFKGHFAMAQGRCHPLTLLDDHSRFAVGLFACPDERTETVRARWVEAFRRYGLPQRITVDNGSPWGNDAEHPYTPLTAWLLRLGIAVSHPRPYHPQTQGKDERFHRTLQLELLSRRSYRDLSECQRSFDQWRDLYNLQRPHEALALATPATRYQPSPHPFPEILPPLEYPCGDIVRKVQDKGPVLSASEGRISYRNRIFTVPKAFCGYPVALRPTQQDGIIDVFFCHQSIAHIDLRNPK